MRRRHVAQREPPSIAWRERPDEPFRIVESERGGLALARVEQLEPIDDRALELARGDRATYANSVCWP